MSKLFAFDSKESIDKVVKATRQVLGTASKNNISMTARRKNSSRKNRRVPFEIWVSRITKDDNSTSFNINMEKGWVGANSLKGEVSLEPTEINNSKKVVLHQSSSGLNVVLKESSEEIPSNDIENIYLSIGKVTKETLSDGEVSWSVEQHLIYNFAWPTIA